MVKKMMHEIMLMQCVTDGSVGSRCLGVRVSTKTLGRNPSTAKLLQTLSTYGMVFRIMKKTIIG